MKKIYVAPSILSADFSTLYLDIKDLKEQGASYLHFDVMDGHFVNNISFGSYVLSSISKKIELIKDIHLMISNPKKYYLDFVKAGADIITFHYEALNNDEEIFNLIKEIKNSGVMVGISIKPGTEVNKIIPFLNDIDLILVMSVEPGFGGQKFMSSSLNKIEFLKKEREKNNYHYKIEVDGGINSETAPLVKKSGADILVSGSYIFKSENRKNAINLLKGE